MNFTPLYKFDIYKDEIEMNMYCYEKLFAALSVKPRKMEESYILSKIGQLDITPPLSLITFYHYFGYCDVILRGYYDLWNIEELKIWHNGLIFGINDENGVLGIKVKDLYETDDPSIYYSCKDSNDWYSELNRDGGSAFFFNIACTNLAYNQKHIAIVNMKKKDFFEKILNKRFLFSFTDDQKVLRGYQRCGCYSESGKIIASYFDLTEILLIGTDQKESLEEFFHETGWKYKIVNKNPSKRLKKPKVTQINKSVMEQCYTSLEQYLPSTRERIDKTIIQQKADELGIVFPQSLIDFYHYFGNYEKILTTDMEFEKLENLHIVNGTLVVAYSNEGIATYGFKINGLTDEEPCISEFADIDCTEETRMYMGHAFFFNAACYNIIFSKPSVVQVKKSHQYFFSKILDKKNVYSFTENRDMKKGFFMCGCHDEECKILGCYVSDEMDTLFLGSDNDEILNAFETKTKWEFDWL